MGQNHNFPVVVALNFNVAPPELRRPAPLAGVQIATADSEPANILATIPMISSDGLGAAPVPVLGLADNADAVAASAVANKQGVMARLTAVDSVSGAWNRLRSTNLSGAALAAPSIVLAAAAYSLVRDSGGLHQLALGAYSTAVATQNGNGASLNASPGEWAIQHTPAAAVQATITRAAGGVGVRHVCRSISAALLATVAQGQIILNLRDGTTGAGAILWSSQFMLLAGDSDRIMLTGLNIVGSANTAMTLEVAAAPAATNFASVSLTGYDTNL